MQQKVIDGLGTLNKKYTQQTTKQLKQSHTFYYYYVVDNFNFYSLFTYCMNTMMTEESSNSLLQSKRDSGTTSLTTSTSTLAPLKEPPGQDIFQTSTVLLS